MESIVNQVLRFASNLIKYRKYYTWNDIVKTKNSGFFDDDYYLKQNPDVVMSDLTPFKHYIQFGCFEGSMPFNGFESYLLRKGNFKKNLIDFVRDPASYEEKTRDLWLGGCKLMEFDSDVQVLQTVSETIAVHVHLFYMSMTDKIVNHLKNIPYKFDIYISIPDPLKLDFIEELFLQSFPESKVTVRVVENRGRDMAPLFVEFASYINKYDIVYLLGQDNLDFKKKNEFVIYQGSHGDKGAEIADIILPGAAFTEQSGHYTNLEGKIQKAYKASYPPGDAKEDWQIINDLAEVMNNRKLFNDKEELESSMFNYLKLKKEQKKSDLPNKIEQSDFENEDLNVKFKDYYFSNVIARSSKTMVECNNSKIDLKKTGTEG